MWCKPCTSVRVQTACLVKEVSIVCFWCLLLCRKGTEQWLTSAFMFWTPQNSQACSIVSQAANNYLMTAFRVSGLHSFFTHSPAPAHCRQPAWCALTVFRSQTCYRRHAATLSARAAGTCVQCCQPPSCSANAAAAAAASGAALECFGMCARCMSSPSLCLSLFRDLFQKPSHKGQGQP